MLAVGLPCATCPWTGEFDAGSKGETMMQGAIPIRFVSMSASLWWEEKPCMVCYTDTLHT